MSLTEGYGTQNPTFIAILQIINLKYLLTTQLVYLKNFKKCQEY